MRLVFHPLFLAVIVIAFWSGLGFYMLACILAVLIHEFSHAAVARHFGVKAKRITLLPFGAAVNLDCSILPRRCQALILFAGALGNAIAGIVAGAFLWVIPGLFGMLGLFIVANTTIAVMNLMPFYPLDGGKIIDLFCGRRTTTAMHVLSNIVFAVLFVVACFALQSWSIALFAICMIFTVNVQGKNEYVVTLAQALDILYNERYGENKKN